jgi:hypothetical protein
MDFTTPQQRATVVSIRIPLRADGAPAMASAKPSTDQDAHQQG